MKKLSLLCASSALFLPSMAFAQSTGTIETEKEPEIVVTGTRVRNGVEGIVAPDSTKARQVLTQEIIARQSPGQTILNTVNLVPGVNFTQSDAYGSAGGNIRIRGFDGNRISLTFDGLPLNDTGNYAIFSNQQLDPELIEQVNVNLGATDVDSPTASAAGGTVNYRTRLPGRTLGGRVAGSIGDFDYARFFGMLDTGDLTSFGTRAFIAASKGGNEKFKGPGENDKQQYNARLYQPLGTGGDFLSVSGHYNRNRNNFYRNPSVGDMRTLLGAGEIPPNAGASPTNPILIGQLNSDQEKAIFNFENDAACIRNPGRPGLADIETTTGTRSTTTASCTSFFGVRINPSDTGNIRANSRFSLTDSLTLTIDPSFQYTLANGGGISTIDENSVRVRGASTAAGRDYNGDGDVLDRIQFYTPNTTNTRRYGLTSSLIYDLSDDHRFRVAYTFDRGRHRQTGEWGYMDQGGHPESVFGGRNGTPVLTADGFTLAQRDRLSIALLHQVAGQYVGNFFDKRLRVEAGLRAPFFTRNLNQYCYTEARGSGFAYCSSEPQSTLRIIAPDAIVPTTGAVPYYAPFTAKYKFDALLPNIGATYRATDSVSIFGSYAKGLSAPRTDNLYRAPIVDIEPEKTDSYDLGVRHTGRRIQAQATAWMINYQNRIVSSFNPDLGISIDRNVGKVKSHGVDAFVGVKPIEPVTLYAFGSYIQAKLQENVQTGSLAAGVTCGDSIPAPAGCAETAGKRVTETPKWQLGGRAMVELGPLELGMQAKYVGDRFATDVNDVRTEGYTLVDLDGRLSLAGIGLEKTYFQLNVINLFDKFYFGNISTQINAAGNPNFSVGAPRTVLGSFNVAF
jgi:iron complex outermembrane receptor protein